MKCEKKERNLKGNTKIHLYIRGNCGNQFFQYAFARQIQETVGGDLVINYCKNAGGKTIMIESDDLLHEFNTVRHIYENRLDFGGYIFKCLKAIQLLLGMHTFDRRTYNFYLKCAKILPFFGVYFFDSAYFPFKIYRRRNIYICGYYESPKYFAKIDDKIRCELTAKKPLLEQNEILYNKILNANSVCVTLKRRDTDNPKYSYDLSYYYEAMRYICKRVSDPVFVIFSDDIEWCKHNINIDMNFVFETPNNPIWEKIRLMSACKHFIIYNSTFSWWAQHLSAYSGKIVVAPRVWMKRDDQPIDIYEDNWVYLAENGTG